MLDAIRALRSAWRLLAVAAATLVFFCVWLSGSPLSMFNRRAGVRWRSFNFRSWSRTVLKIIGAEVVDTGAPPEPPFFLVSNHVSYVDILVLASRADAFFVAKSEVARWPVLGFLCRCMGTIFIDRQSSRDLVRVLARIERVLEDGHGLVLFPEGTSTDGSEVRRFLPSLLEPPAQLCQPVSYASLRYVTPTGEPPPSQAICWWGEMTFPDHLWRLLSLSGFRAHVDFGVEEIQHDDRKLLATRLRDAVIGQLSPTWDSA